MRHALWLVPALPLLGFVVLTLVGGRLSRRAQAAVGVAAVGLSALLALALLVDLVASPPAGGVYRQPLWRWVAIDELRIAFGLLLDPLSAVMMAVVTVVGLLIHVYATVYMGQDAGHRRFFAWMNLFVGAMLLLVLADNLLLLYLGWEGVGLASYLLIGFWYEDPVNGRAARKAFIVTRVGDAALALALVLFATELGTLDLVELAERAPAAWAVGSTLAVLAAALVWLGAAGKSAQLPLQTWLPDAMAGPTPVSALIHAATMVTAGVYLIARTHVLLRLAPSIQLLVAVLGAATMLMAGLSALAQRDLKRVLAYSTMSQIGLMFLALGVGAFGAAILQLVVHAFFKALLFLAGGVVILGAHGEHDVVAIGQRGRLSGTMPFACACFFVGACSLTGVPLVTAGFYSKEAVLASTLTSPAGGPLFFGAALLGSFLTGLYVFRVFFLVFLGPAPSPGAELARGEGPAGGEGPAEPTAWRLRWPMAALGVLALVGGVLEVPPFLGEGPRLTSFFADTLPVPAEAVGHRSGWLLAVVGSAVALAGILAAGALYGPARRQRAVARRLQEDRPGPAPALRRLAAAGFGADRLQELLLVRPFLWLARKNRDDVIDGFYRGLGRGAKNLNQALGATQSGRLGRYALAMATGAALLLAAVVLFT